MPKQTMRAPSARAAPRCTARWKASRWVMKWSEGIATSTGSSAESACTAASVSAGAVPRPIGSSRIALARAPERRSCVDHEAMAFVADHQRLGRDAVGAAQAQGGLLQQRALAVQGVELLRKVLARKRPQAG